MRAVVVVIIASILASLQGGVMEGGIVGDVRELRKVNRRIEVDISDIARKHVALGQKKRKGREIFYGA
ncbi:hypothetical protein [Chromobacterium sp. CV08]|uniref:hypothetical protein n=1 Tax=Chromobacterium sp. CV08 TaxID=3133274 RepID=UPI003DA809DF